jgi:hypothetical protein
MAKPAGVARATKDNSKKHPQQRDEWMKGKKIGRKKQVWVPLNEGAGPEGLWSKVQ